VSVRPVAAAVSGRGVVDPTTALVAADDDGFARGCAAFETLRVYAGRPFRLGEHLDRLVTSAERIGLPAPDPAAVGALAEAALDAARLPDAVLRLYWTPGPPGQRLVSLPFPRRSAPWLLPGTKSVSYATHMAAEAEAKRRGADDALLVDLDGIVLEGPVTNIWWREGDLLVTPSFELGILAGETRAALIGVAAGLGYGVEQGAYPLERLLAADEVLTSSSVREVMPIRSVDGRDYGSREAADALQRELRRVAVG
jgi:branched-subunit amino acid aminotransferase/4-amino-4-deoxychorismate lyase